METRNQHKRPWQSTPSQKARMELDFGQNTPSPKRIKLSSHVSNDDLEDDSFTVKSFYGKREKLHFPHSPGRRKAAGKVLEKLSDESADSENDSMVGKRNRNRSKKQTEHDTSKFDFHSSDSADAEGEGNTCNRGQVLKQRSMNNGGKKIPLNVTKINKTPRNRVSANEKEKANTTGKIKSRVKELEDEVRTPITRVKKFFKSRSPASADKVFGNVVIMKGFDLKFCPRRLNMSSSKLDKKNQSKCKKKTETKTMPVKSVNAKDVKPFSEEMFFISDNEKTDGSAAKDPTAEEAASDIEYVSTNYVNSEEKSKTKSKSVVEIADSSAKGVVNSVDEHVNCEELRGSVKSKQDKVEKSDSGVETSNSNDLFTSSPGVSEKDLQGDMDITSQSESVAFDQDVDSDKMSDITSETVSLIGVGSDSLFSDSGRNTPVLNLASGENTRSKQPASSPMTLSPTSSTSGTSEITSVASGSDSSKPKLFPIFMKKGTPRNSSQLESVRGRSSPGGIHSPGSTQSPLLKYVKSKDNMEQMIIDAGQKRYGAVQCEVCGMVYSIPDDEVLHHKFHTNLWSALKFTGWKKEHVVQQYQDTGSRVIMVTSESPKYATKKVEEINRIMGEELGFPEPGLTFRASYKAFLYVSEEKKIEGCCVAEPVREGYRVLLDSQQSGASPQKHPGHRPWCCSDQPEKALIGISRIWVYSQARRKGIATKLLDCVRQWALYGIEIPKQKMAFSDPTPDGKILATKYTGTPCFLVYKYHSDWTKRSNNNFVG